MIRRSALFLCAFAWSATAQDLPPDILLLSRIKAHMRNELAQLPNYTCLESIARYHKEAHESKFRPLDSVQLEIVYSGGHEWYGSPGDGNLSQDPVSFIGAGMISNGMFAISMHNLFVAGGATFTAKDEDKLAGRAAVKYAFRLPRMLNHFQISLPGGNGMVGEAGSFWADRASFDVLRLDGRVTEIPPLLPLASAEYKVIYARTRIAEWDALLAQQADMHMVDLAGVEEYDRFDFTHCRAFHTDTAIRFDTNPPERTEALPDMPRRVSQSETIPALLPVTVELTTPITDHDPVGKLIAGRIVGNVQRKGHVVIEDGAPVRGRIRRLDRYGQGDYFVLGLEFTEVQLHGVPVRFYADLFRMEKRKGIRLALREPVRLPAQETATAEILLPELPGVASFFVEGKTLRLEPGLRTVWRTRGPLRGTH